MMQKSTKSDMLTTSLLLKVDTSLDFCFPMDSEMNSDFKLDLVERLFAIDPEPKTPFTTQVVMPEEFCFLPVYKLAVGLRGRKEIVTTVLFSSQEMEDTDLEMLAPYISMDDDFQLRSLAPDEPLPCRPASSVDASAVCVTVEEVRSSPSSRTASPAPPEPVNTPHLVTIIKR